MFLEYGTMVASLSPPFEMARRIIDQAAEMDKESFDTVGAIQRGLFGQVQFMQQIIFQFRYFIQNGLGNDNLTHLF